MRVLIVLVIVLAVVAVVAVAWAMTSRSGSRDRPPTPHEVYAQIITEANRYWDDDPDRALRMYTAAEQMLERLGEPKPATPAPRTEPPELS